jgi:hypothetical protein
MGVSGGDAGRVLRQGGNYVVAASRTSRHGAGPARRMGEFRCPMTQV